MVVEDGFNVFHGLFCSDAYSMCEADESGLHFWHWCGICALIDWLEHSQLGES